MFLSLALTKSLTSKPWQSESVGDCLQPSLDTAITENDTKAKWTGYALTLPLDCCLTFQRQVVCSFSLMKNIDEYLTASTKLLSFWFAMSINLLKVQRQPLPLVVNPTGTLFNDVFYFYIGALSTSSCSCEGNRNYLSPVPKTLISSFENVEHFRWTMGNMIRIDFELGFEELLGNENEWIFFIFELPAWSWRLHNPSTGK